MLDLFVSNRFEALAAVLAQRIATRRALPLEEDVVVVPSAAVRRALTLALARRHGVCANLRFVYLAQWLWSLASRADPGVPRGSPFDAQGLSWRAYAAFDDTAFIAPFPRLQRYLQAGDALARFELATEVAGLLTQYATYRNDWLETWQRSRSVDALPEGAREDEAWQAALWRRMVEGLHLPGINPLRDFGRRLSGEDDFARAVLPSEAHVFCLPDIAPLHLEVLRALGRKMPLHVYALNPCESFWFDLVDPRSLARLEVTGQRDHHEVGHRLLAGWGRQSASHLEQLYGAAEGGVDESAYVAPGDACLLHRLQGSILNQAELAPGSVPVRDEDRSITFHACHARAREIEVLHDRLLGLFAADANLSPSDVLVVTPDLETTAPLIDAVFGAVPQERRIPYAISGLGRGRVNPEAHALLAVLALAGSRWTASALQACLELPPIAARFGLDADALERIRGWIETAGVRWGANPSHRVSLGLPPDARHTVEDGLSRLLLGYALPGDVDLPFDGRLPAGDAEGSDALALGAFARFARELEQLRARIASPLSAPAWAALLTDVLSEFVDPGEPEDRREVELAISGFAAVASRGIGALALPVEVVQSALEAALDDPARGGVPSGAVTFAALSSLRALPYKVICLIGLDDAAFPANARPREFDLIAAAPRAGDRQRRADDRSLFLDLLLAAREALHLSYVGRGVRDNAERPPSVLVAELLDYLAMASATDPSDPKSVSAARARLVTTQPLQAFSERAFRADATDDVRSYNREFADALNARAAAPPALTMTGAGGFAGDEAFEDDAPDGVFEAASPFFAAPLVSTEVDAVEVIAFDDLLRYFQHPARFLLSRVLGIRLQDAPEEVLDDEPFVAQRTDLRALSKRLMPRLLEGLDPDAALAFALAGTEVPHGPLGVLGARQEVERMHRFATRVRERLRGSLVAPHSVSLSLEIEGRHRVLEGSLADLRPEGLIRWRDDKARATDRLEAWLHQLLLAASPPAGVRPQVAWLCRDIEIGFVPVGAEAARQALAALASLYLRGLREPLPFFPRSAWALAESDWQRAKAVGTWRSNSDKTYPESSDPACRLVQRGLVDPFSDAGFPAFETCARAVFGPLLASLEER